MPNNNSSNKNTNFLIANFKKSNMTIQKKKVWAVTDHYLALVNWWPARLVVVAGFVTAF